MIIFIFYTLYNLKKGLILVWISLRVIMKATMDNMHQI